MSDPLALSLMTSVSPPQTMQSGKRATDQPKVMQKATAHFIPRASKMKTLNWVPNLTDPGYDLSSWMMDTNSGGFGDRFSKGDTFEAGKLSVDDLWQDFFV